MDQENINIEGQQTTSSLRYGYQSGYTHAMRALFSVSENGQQYTSNSLPGTHMEHIQICIIPNPVNYIEYYRAYNLGWKCGEFQMYFFNLWKNEKNGSGKTGTESSNTTFDIYSNPKNWKMFSNQS